MKAVLCPVCNGKGQVIPNWDCWDGRTLIDCHGCAGKGWIEVNDNPLFYNPYCPPSIDPTACPSCGGDRSGPPGTGCPIGSHYGTYSEV